MVGMGTSSRRDTARPAYVRYQKPDLSIAEVPGRVGSSSVRSLRLAVTPAAPKPDLKGNDPKGNKLKGVMEWVRMVKALPQKGKDQKVCLEYSEV